MGVEIATLDARMLPFAGRLIRPTDSGHEAKRMLRNWSIARRSAAMLRCRNTAVECAANSAQE